MKIKTLPVKQKITVSQTVFAEIVGVTPQRISKVANQNYGSLALDENKKIYLLDSIDRWFKYLDVSKIRDGNYKKSSERKKEAIEKAIQLGYKIEGN